jgi:hypothetical protein
LAKIYSAVNHGGRGLQCSSDSVHDEIRMDRCKAYSLPEFESEFPRTGSTQSTSGLRNETKPSSGVY